MSAPLLPQAFWFRLALNCPRVEGVPRASGNRLLELPDSCRLPDFNRLDGKQDVVTVKAGWNPGGLALEFEVEGEPTPWMYPEDTTGAYTIDVWVDTRDTRDVSRATRFCHAFKLRLVPLAGRSKKFGLEAAQRPIPRAVADAPLGPPGAIQSRLISTRRTWGAELFLGAAALNGFDPETNRRLGFAFQVWSPDLPHPLNLGAGGQFPVGENPSLWSTLELTEAR